MNTLPPSGPPLAGCQDLATAAVRAADLLPAPVIGNGGDRGYWNAQARRVLAALMHAAAFGVDLTMDDISRWVSDPHASEREILSLLENSPMPGCLAAAQEFIDTNQRTRASIAWTISLGLATARQATGLPAPVLASA